MPPPPVRTSHPIIPIARANTVLGALPENHSSTLSRRSVLGGPILEAPVGTAPEGNARCAPFPHLSLTIMIIDNEELRPPVSPPLPPRQPPADRPASPKRRFTCTSPYGFRGLICFFVRNRVQANEKTCRGRNNYSTTTRSFCVPLVLEFRKLEAKTKFHPEGLEKNLRPTMRHSPEYYSADLPSSGSGPCGRCIGCHCIFMSRSLASYRPVISIYVLFTLPSFVSTQFCGFFRTAFFFSLIFLRWWNHPSWFGSFIFYSLRDGPSPSSVRMFV